jgi:hypothetical protein
MSDIKELIERMGMFNEEILQTRIKMNTLEQDLYKDILALTELNFEIWRDIKGYEGLYQISNLGNVRNTKTLRILKPRINTHKYKHIDLRRNGKRKSLNIHRPIALAFIPNPENKLFVDHINNIRSDNSLKNLRWVSYQENNRNSSLSKNNTSRIKGVSFHKRRNRWYAHITINGKQMHLGYFQNIGDAKEARQRKAKELFGIYINKCEQ